jgi:hypothetical protein
MQKETKQLLAGLGFLLNIIGIFLLIAQPLSPPTGAVINLSTPLAKQSFFIGILSVIIGFTMILASEKKQKEATVFDEFSELYGEYRQRGQQYIKLQSDTNRPARNLLQDALALADKNLVANTPDQRESKQIALSGITQAESGEQLAEIYKVETKVLEADANELVKSKGLENVLSTAPDSYTQSLLEKIEKPKLEGNYNDLAEQHAKLLGLSKKKQIEVVMNAYKSEYDLTNPIEKRSYELLQALTQAIPEIIEGKYKTIMKKKEEAFYEALKPNMGGYLAEQLKDKMIGKDGALNYVAYHTKMLEELQEAAQRAEQEKREEKYAPGRTRIGRRYSRAA